MIVTRPQPQADEWVAQLQALGLPAAALPLLGIAGAPDPAAVAQAWQALPAQRLVMFVSPVAVERFFAGRPAGADAAAGAAGTRPGAFRAADTWPANTWAGATGPGTVRALVAAGVPAACIVSPPADSPRFDSEALWAQLQPRGGWQDSAVMVVRGEGGRDWLADTLRQHGARLHFVEAYRRTAPVPDAAGHALLQAACTDPSAHAWLFSSSEAAGHLPALLADHPGQLRPWSGAQARALATHPRIAEAARALGFARVDTVAPTPQAVATALSDAA